MLNRNLADSDAHVVSIKQYCTPESQEENRRNHRQASSEQQSLATEARYGVLKS